MSGYDRINLTAALVQKLRGAGMATVEDLVARNSRELLLLPGVGPGTLRRIVDALTAAGLDLAEDPYAAYICARHSDPARDAELRGYFLCDVCRYDYAHSAFSGRDAEWVSGEEVDGYCGHCNDLTAVRLSQWFLCGTCDRVVRSIGRGIASAKFVEEMWQAAFGPHSYLRLTETDPVLLQPRGTRSKPGRAASADFVATENGTGEILLGLELKTGRSPLPGGGIGNPMSQFQLDTTDCDDISAASDAIDAPVFLVHAQVIGRAHAPTERFEGVGLWFARPWDLLPHLEDVRRRPRETRNAAYFSTAAFRSFGDFSRYIDEEFPNDMVEMEQLGFPRLYERR